MLDINAIRRDKEPLMRELKKRGTSFDIDDFLRLDKERRDLIQKVDGLRADQKEAGKKVVSLEGTEKQSLLLELKAFSERLTEEEAKLAALTQEWEKRFMQLPNYTHETVPPGGIENNRIEKEGGQKRDYPFTPRPHWEILEQQHWFDLQRGARVAGSRFWYLMGDLARLQMALHNWIFALVAQKGYLPVIPPYLVKETALYNTGFFPGADESEIYRIPNPDEGEDLLLIGTSEISLVSLHDGESIDLTQGPLKYLGTSPCFRREAGTYGKDVKGIIRGHQFDKVEMVIFCTPEESWQLFDELLGIQEEILNGLGLTYRLPLCAAGETSKKSAKTIEPEAWFPGEGRYIEVMSVSNVTDYQARRMHVKYKDAEGKKVLAHTLNATAVALSRMLAAIIETYQQEDGTVVVPEPLRAAMGSDVMGVPHTASHA